MYGVLLRLSAPESREVLISCLIHNGIEADAIGLILSGARIELWRWFYELFAI
jgi:hypothetical protein